MGGNSHLKRDVDGYLYMIRDTLTVADVHFNELSAREGSMEEGGGNRTVGMSLFL